MRVAFFGGSFDPPHRGHLAIARAAIARLSLDLVWMAPAGTQPLKRNAPATSFQDRLTMVELATAGDPILSASNADAPRKDGTPNYSIDVLLQMKAGLASGDTPFFLLGADAFLTIGHWHRAAELVCLCDFIVAGRPGFALGDITGALPGQVSAGRTPGRDANGLIAWTLTGQDGQSSHLYLMPDLHEEISATDIREAVAGDEAAEGVLCPAVFRYIQEKGLYR